MVLVPCRLRHINGRGVWQRSIDKFTICFSYSPTFPHPTDLGRLSSDGKTGLHPAGARAVPLEAGGDQEHRQDIYLDSILYFLYGSLPHTGCNGVFVDHHTQ